MKIRKARKEDFEEYSKLKEEDFKEYGKLIQKKINYSKKDSKKEFQRILKSSEDYLLFAEEKNVITGFIHGEIKEKEHEKKSEIEYLYVVKEYRKKGIATNLIKYFISMSKLKGCKIITLKVNKRNVKAIKLYDKFGFDITNYVMRKKLK